MQAASGPAERVEPTCSFRARHPEPLCSRYCGPSAKSCTEVSHEPVARSIESRSSQEASQGPDPSLSSRDAESARAFSPCASGGSRTSDEEIAALELRLHDAQSCLARDTASPRGPICSDMWKRRRLRRRNAPPASLHWLGLVYPATSAAPDRANPRVARRMLAESPDLVAGDPYLACAIGDETALRQATQADPSWLNRPGGPLRLPPLFAVAHSACCGVPEFRERLHRQREIPARGGRRPQPADLQPLAAGFARQPDERYPLSALYGAAGSNHDAAMTRLLLEAGADPNDGESLYHSLENPRLHPPVAGARRSHRGSNAIYRCTRPRQRRSARAAAAAWRRPERAGAQSAAERLGFSAVVGDQAAALGPHVEALLEAGADPRGDTAAASTLTAWRCSSGSCEVAELLRGPRRRRADLGRRAVRGGLRAWRRSRGPAHPRGATRSACVAARGSNCDCCPTSPPKAATTARRLMVRLGWPIAVRGGDWDASALNHAVFRGDAALDTLPARTRCELDRGARLWR